MIQYNYSEQIRRALNRFFEGSSYSTPIYVGDNIADIRFNNHNFNPVFLRISNNHTRGVYEVPSAICNSRTVTEVISESFGDIVAPLSIINIQTRRSADSILKYLFNNTNYLGLKKAVTSKGKVYYGTPGLILDSDFKPIMIGISGYIKTGSGVTFDKHVLKISPRVFISDGLLEKTIIKKLIPYYTSNSIDGSTVRVEIDDIDGYVVKPVPPKDKVQETMKDIMYTYRDEILEDFIL